MLAPTRARNPSVASTRVVIDAKRGRTYEVFRPAAATSVTVDFDAAVARVLTPPGAYRDTEAWTSRDVYLAALEWAVRTIWRPFLRRTAKDATSPDTYMRWARREAGGADHATGRGMRESVATIARDLGVSEALVRRCRRISRDLGIYRDIIGGRLLRLRERLAVYERGSTQRGVTGERAFTVTKLLRPFIHMLTRARRLASRNKTSAVSSATHPRRGPVSGHLPSGQTQPSTQTKKKVGRSATRSSTRKLAPGERLARQLVPLLAYGRDIQPRRVARACAPFEKERWAPHQVVNAMNAEIKRLERIIPKTMKSPGGYLCWLLSQLNPYDENFTPAPPRPPKCAVCSPNRLIEVGPDRTPKRCPNCHPLAVDADGGRQ